MNAVVKGAKAGAEKSRKAVISPDSAQSKTYIKILYGLSEGQIKGLVNGFQSIYLDDTPLQDANASWNFEHVTVDTREGTNDQTYIEGFRDISSEESVAVELKSGTPWVKAFTNLDLDAIGVRLKWGPLREQNAENGDVNGVTIEYAIDVQTDGGAWVESLNAQVSDKTSANYERSHRIDLPKANVGWQIRVRRITPNTTSEFISDKMYVQAVTEVIDAKLRYPNTALLGLQYDAETFSNVAKMAVECEGLEILVPINYDAVTRAYTGMWDGTFKRTYTNNPAWHFYDVCITKRYALGDRINSAIIDKWSIYRLAQYCDQLVPNGKGETEPRFTLNVYEQSQEDAWTVLSKMAGVFRAFIYWNGQQIVCDADIPQDTYFTYTSANVIDGNFEYSGTRARDRHTVAKVAWDNPNNRYKTEYVIVRDEAAIARLGIRIVDIAAWGCTSEGQAQRAGQWALKSEQYETRTVTFKVGLDGYLPLPGKVIEVADPIFAGRANGGRISLVSADRKKITLDRDDVICRAGDRLVINAEDGKAQARIVQSISARVITVVSAFDAVAAQNVWVVDAQDLATMKFRVISITQDDAHQFTIHGLQYNPQKYDAIDHGAIIDDRPISMINPTVQAPVESVSISSEEMVQQGLTVATMLITWPQVVGAVKYLVEWRKDDGSWIILPLSGNNSVEVQGIYSGNYQARVVAISAFDISSLATYSVLTTLSGKQGKPPQLAYLNAQGILFGMKLTWGFPAVGALDTAYTELEVSPDTVNNIAQLGLFAYPTTTHSIQGMQPNLTQNYRGRLIDRIGNIGDWSDWSSGTTSADASAILDILSGKITESQLHQDLQTKIDTIETIDGSISGLEDSIQSAKDSAQKANADLAIERQDRITAINSTVSKIDTEIADRETAITQVSDGLTKQIKDGDTAVLQVVDTVKKSSDAGIAAVQSDIKVVADNLTISATKVDGVYAQVNPPLVGSTTDLIGSESGFAGVWSEQSARIENDMAIGIRIDTTVAQIADVQAFAQSEVTARVKGDEATVQKIDSYIASNDSALSSVRQTANSAVSKSDANASSITALDSRVVTAESNASTAKTNAASAVTKADTAVTTAGSASTMAQQASATATSAKSTADTAISNSATALSTSKAASDASSAASSKVDAVEAKLGDYATTGALSSLDSKVSDVDGRLNATSTKVDGVYAQVNPPLVGSTTDLIGSESGFAGVWSEQSARIENDMAQSIRTDQVIAQISSNDAVYSQQIKATADAVSANVTATNTLQTKVGQNTASIETQQSSINGINLQYTLKLDSRGYVSGIGLMNDGKTSNMIINADMFALGNPAGSTGTTYPFIFRTSAYTDPDTGTVFPIAAYMKSAFLDYASIKTAHIQNLTVSTAKIANAAITNAKIDDLAVSTLKIQNEAVTVPVGLNIQAMIRTTAAVYGRYEGRPSKVGDEIISAFETAIGDVIPLTMSRSGGKLLIMGGMYIDAKLWANNANNDSPPDLSQPRLFISVYVGGALISRASYPRTGVSTAYPSFEVLFNGYFQIPHAIVGAGTGVTNIVVKVGFGASNNLNTISLRPSENQYIQISSRSMTAMELKK